MQGAHHHSRADAGDAGVEPVANAGVRAATRPAGAPPPALRVLVADDSDGFREVARSWIATQPHLRLAGEARSGREAIDAVEAAPAGNIDLVLMDAAMPGVDGFEATRHIKATPGAPAVVVLTFHDGAVARTKALEAGADGFVSKPDMTDTLGAEIARLFTTTRPAR